MLDAVGDLRLRRDYRYNLAQPAVQDKPLPTAQPDAFAAQSQSRLNGLGMGSDAGAGLLNIALPINPLDIPLGGMVADAEVSAHGGTPPRTSGPARSQAPA